MFIFTVRKRSLQRLCFYTCLSVHRGCLQAHTRGLGGLAGGLHTQGEVGGLAGGCPGPGLGGVQAQAQGGSPGPAPGVCVSQHALRQTPPLHQTATAVDGTQPTGMHFCSFIGFHFNAVGKIN